VARQDYILRMIEMAGRALRMLLRGLRAGDVGADEMKDRLRTTAEGVGLDLELLRQVDLDTLVLLVSPGGEPEIGRCWVGAELFAVDAEGAELGGDAEGALDSCRRALRLYALVDPSVVAAGFPEVTARVEEIRARLDRVEALLEAGPA
jgi:hypothetical protein